MAHTHKFQVGDIVALNSHPLFKSHSKIIEFSAQVPPIMLIKEIFYEDSKKKKIYSESLGGDYKIADLIKYTCVYFNANKSEFAEVFVYETFLKSYLDLKYYRKVEDEENVKKIEEDKQLIGEVASYSLITNYEFGKVIQFKTKKLEHRKSYDNNTEKITNSSFQTPDFILSGIKQEINTDLFYQDGTPKRVISSNFIKVTWFNHFQQKNSEQYLPIEFFVENIPF